MIRFKNISSRIAYQHSTRFSLSFLPASARAHGCRMCRNVFWKENSNANMENIAGKLKKLNSMSNVIRLDFWDFVAVEAESCMLSIMKGNLHLRFVF